MKSIGSRRPESIVWGMSWVIAKRWTEPLVAWLSTVSSGCQGCQTRVCSSRISRLSWRMWSRFRLMPAALTRVPTSAGPFCPMSFSISKARLAVFMASLPSALKIGTTTSVIVSSSPASAPESRSRTSMSADSLPSTSPAWMQFCSITTGRSEARAAAGSKAPSVESTSSGSSRPCGVCPKLPTRRRGLPSCRSSSMKAMTWAWVLVARYPLTSATVRIGMDSPFFLAVGAESISRHREPHRSSPCAPDAVA